MTSYARRQKDRRRKARGRDSFWMRYSYPVLVALMRRHTAQLDEELDRRQRYYADAWRQALELALDLEPK